MQMVQCKCQSCGNELKLDLDNLQAYCPSCGSKLLIDMEMLGQIIIEREKNKTEQLRIKKETALKKDKQDDKTFLITMGMMFLCMIIMFFVGVFLT